jgi:hypothetical protein
MGLNVTAQVEIDPRGCPIRVSLWKRMPDEPLARLVVEALQRAVYVPAKTAGTYITSRLWFTTIIDVRAIGDAFHCVTQTGVGPNFSSGGV